MDGKGKQRKTYRYENMLTPYNKLESLPNANAKDNISITTVTLSVSLIRTEAHSVASPAIDGWCWLAWGRLSRMCASIAPKLAVRRKNHVEHLD